MDRLGTAYDFVIGQARNVEAQTTPLIRLGDRLGRTAVTRGDRIIEMVLVVEENIKQRLIKEGRYRGEAPWRIEPGTLGDLGLFDAIAVFYGASAEEPGAIWEESSGNKFRDDYRRLAYRKSIRAFPPGEGLFCELESRFSEENLERMFNQRCLETFR